MVGGNVMFTDSASPALHRSVSQQEVSQDRMVMPSAALMRTDESESQFIALHVAEGMQSPNIVVTKKGGFVF